MAADWESFIENVSDKFKSHEIKDIDELSEFLSEEYINAIDGKAQTPYGNTHKKPIGGKEILKESFSKAFNLLSELESPSIEEKENDPLYADLEGDIDIPKTDIDFDIDFEKWLNVKKDQTAFIYHKIFNNIPENIEGSVDELAKKIIYYYKKNPTNNFILWLFLLRASSNNINDIEYLNRVFDRILEIENTDIVLEEYNTKIFQESSNTYPNKFPSYLSDRYIKRYTYNQDIVLDIIRNIKKEEINNNIKIIPEVLLETTSLRKFIISNINYNNLSNNITIFISSYNNNINNYYQIESNNYLNLKREYIKEIENANKKASEILSNEYNEDPFYIMAEGINKYWISASIRPFQSSPPIYPCNINSPGTYSPIYYGSQIALSNNLRRAFNSGKRFKKITENEEASKMIAKALAICFSSNLLEFKLLYIGSVSSGPMTGFIPYIF